MAYALSPLMSAVPTRVGINTKTGRRIFGFSPHWRHIKEATRESLIVRNTEHTSACGVDANRVTLRRIERGIQCIWRLFP